ncbi:MAG TPA: hypothetical protein IAA13_05435 [Candidatus Alistipes merdigallinarum]|nr:hypothetical protein [Candidatus Alistipes merdigallinarum]
MQTRYIILTLLLLLCFRLSISSGYGQTAKTDHGIDSIALYFEGLRNQQQEKLWLHLNQPYYAAGDTIWFRAYLTNAMTHRRDTLSNFVYVDLVDQRGSFILSKKIKRDSLGFANGIPLSDTLPTGDYTLRAYTGWMLNFDSSFYYQHNLKIGSVRVKEMHTEVTYLTGRAIVRFMDDRGNPFQGVEARCILYDRTGKKVSGFKQESSTTGAIFVDFEDDSLRVGEYMEAEFEDQGFRYRERVYFEPVKRTYTVQFLPEGGEMLSGVLRRIAFKSEGSDGYPMDIEGCILNSSGGTVTSFRSEHDGMGSFFMQGTTGEQYRAVCTSEDGEQKSFPLPEVKEQGSALSIFQTQGGIRYRIDGTFPEGGFLVGHQRGRCCFVVSLEESRTTGKICTDSIGSGILHLLLTDHTGRRLSERLVFVEGQELTRVSVAADKPAYGKRERVRIDLDIQDKKGIPIEADLSVSVTNRKVISYDSLGGNIKNYLLLTSDLKGYIHNPGYYFEQGGDSIARRYHLDLVMMTHGWRRFPSDNLFRPAPFSPKHFFERGQYISGQVISTVGLSAKNAQVDAIALTGDNVLGMTITDSSGYFILDGLDYKGPTLFMITAKTARGKGKTIPFIEFDTLYPRPEVKQKKLYNSIDSSEDSSIINSYVDQRKRNYEQSHFFNGYDLDEIVVEATNLRKPQTSPMGNLYDTADLAPYKKVPLYMYLSTLPGITTGTTGDEENIRCFKLKKIDGLGFTPAQLRIDNRIVSNINEVRSYNVDDVEYLNIVKTTGGKDGDAGINMLDYPYRIEIYLKEDRNTKKNYMTYRTLGYSEKMEFYSPIYDTPERADNPHPDNRTTLYWNPYVQTDTAGKSFVEFYSDDREDAELEITIEGVTDEGVPVFHRSGVIANGDKANNP